MPKTSSTSVRAILGKAWKPHPNLWEIENLMEREQQYTIDVT